MQPDSEDQHLEVSPGQQGLVDESNMEELATDDQQLSEPDSDADITHVSWQALESLPVQRSTGWYVGLVLVTLVFMAVAVFLIESWSFSLVIAAAAAALAVYTKRPPKTINYTLSPKGLYVGDELRPVEDYKAFGVRREGDHFMLIMLPTKRFMPGLLAYFPESVGEEVVDILATRIPMQEVQPDIVDNIVRKLRL